MSLDLSTVGYTTSPCKLTYDWKTLAAYTLGIGAKRDELQYLYEGAAGGMKVYPTFGVIPSYDAVIALLVKTQADLAMIVHGGQKIRVHRPLRSPRPTIRRSWPRRNNGHTTR